MNKEKKTERIDLRLTKSQKEELLKSAENNGQTLSEYIISNINNNTNLISHEQYISDSLYKNQFINNLLINSELSNKSKQIISKEMRNYV